MIPLAAASAPLPDVPETQVREAVLEPFEAEYESERKRLQTTLRLVYRERGTMQR